MILDLIEAEEEIGAEIESADTYNQRVHDLLLTMKAHVTRGATPPGERRRDPSATVSRQARLPKLNLPVFDGRLTSWLPFWELYDSAVHSNPELYPIQKFTYLKTLLSGVAKEAVGGLSLTAENYDEAVEVLTKRFGNKQRIIDRHMTLLLNVERVSSTSNTVALRNLHDKVETNVRALKALGVADSMYGSLLSSVLVSRLPSELQLMAGREIKEAD